MARMKAQEQKTQTAHRDLIVMTWPRRLKAIGKNEKRHGGHAIVLARLQVLPPSTSSIFGC
jgi:hypothetical protein